MCRDQPWERLEHRQSAGGIPLFFSLDVDKILILLGLRRRDLPPSGQNIGSKELSGKILRNKELGEERVRTSRIANWLELGRTMPLCAFYLLGQGCSSHACSFFCAGLWKSGRAFRALRGTWEVSFRDLGPPIFTTAARQSERWGFIANNGLTCVALKHPPATSYVHQEKYPTKPLIRS